MPRPDYTNVATIRFMSRFVLLCTVVLGAGWWMDATMNDGVFRSFYIVMGVLLAVVWCLLGLFHLMLGASDA